MFRYFIVIIGLLLFLPINSEAHEHRHGGGGHSRMERVIIISQNQTVSSSLISQIQSQFRGQVVGVNDMPDGVISEVQVLLPDGQVVVVTVDKSSNSIVNVKR